MNFNPGVLYRLNVVRTTFESGTHDIHYLMSKARQHLGSHVSDSVANANYQRALPFTFSSFLHPCRNRDSDPSTVPVSSSIRLRPLCTKMHTATSRCNLYKVKRFFDLHPSKNFYSPNFVGTRPRIWAPSFGRSEIDRVIHTLRLLHEDVARLLRGRARTVAAPGGRRLRPPARPER